MDDITLYDNFAKHDQGVDEGKRMAGNGVVIMAHHLKAIKEGKLYTAQGDNGQNTWAAYLGQKGINISTANKYISLYSFYVEEMGKLPQEIGEMSIDSLSKYQSALAKSEPAKREELFETMKSGLSISDLHKTFVEHKLAKPHWLFIKRCATCNKYEIHYVQSAVCHCKAGDAVFVKPEL